MSILQNILAEKDKEIADRKRQLPLDLLRRQCSQTNQPRGFEVAVRKSRPIGYIAEIKRASPSKGVIRGGLDPVKTALSYAEHGASCLSVLTDEKFFSGHLDFLPAIRTAVPNVPLLRKDFIIDEYQVWEARVAGADAILLIVAALEEAKLRELTAVAIEAELDVLIEVHDVSELERACIVFDHHFLAKNQRSALLVGINNRNLHSFETDLSVTEMVMQSAKEILHGQGALTTSDRPLFVSESGIKTGGDVCRLVRAGVSAVLVGESLVAAGDPGENLGRLIAEAACA